MATATINFVKNANLGGFGDKRQRTVAYYGTVTFSAPADTYLTGGLLPLAGADLKSLGPFADRTPLSVRVWSQAASGISYLYNVVTGKLLAYSGAAAADAVHGAVEITTGTALSATTPAISTDTLNFEAIFAAGATA